MNCAVHICDAGLCLHISPALFYTVPSRYAAFYADGAAVAATANTPAL